MKLRVHVEQLSLQLVDQAIAVPSPPDKVLELLDSGLPDTFAGMAFVRFGMVEMVIRWEFAGSVVEELRAKLLADPELDSATVWSQNTFQAWYLGTETGGIPGVIAVSVER